MVRNPWMTSNPNSKGMPSRLSFDGDPLQSIDLGGVGDEQQCSGASCLNGGFDHRRELHHGCRERIVVGLP